MHKIRRFYKKRKPEKHVWPLSRRNILVRRKDVTPEEFVALRDYQKFPVKLLRSREEPFRCGTPIFRAAEFVGPRRLSFEAKHKGYPLTNWKRKRLKASFMHRFTERRFLKNPRFF